MLGDGPPSDGGVRIGKLHENEPELLPADHVDDACSDEAVKSPAPPDGPAASARNVAPAAGTATSAVTRRVRASLRDASGVARQAAASGVASAHDGSATSL